MPTRSPAPYLATWLIAASIALVLLLLPAPVAARAAPPTGNWEGTIVIFRDGVPRGRAYVELTISSLRLGRISARASWLRPPRCTDILRLERARAGHWRFSIAATIGACTGRTWIYDVTRPAARRLRLRATSADPRFEGVVYLGTLVRSG
ncbi:MAG: hypothetical protein ACRDQ2_00825 [Gaiellales bacterium]